MHTKDFQAWMVLKEEVDNERQRPAARQGEIRWCALGHNIGSEIDGKGTLFARPALILRQLSPNTCFILPLTHSKKTGNFVHEFEFQGEQIKARLDQARVVDLKRIKGKVGELSERKLRDIANRAAAFLFGSDASQAI